MLCSVVLRLSAVEQVLARPAWAQAACCHSALSGRVLSINHPGYQYSIYQLVYQSITRFISQSSGLSNNHPVYRLIIRYVNQSFNPPIYQSIFQFINQSSGLTSLRIEILVIWLHILLLGNYLTLIFKLEPATVYIRKENAKKNVISQTKKLTPSSPRKINFFLKFFFINVFDNNIKKTISFLLLRYFLSELVTFCI